MRFLWNGMTTPEKEFPRNVNQMKLSTQTHTKKEEEKDIKIWKVNSLSAELFPKRVPNNDTNIVACNFGNWNEFFVYGKS